MSTGDLRYRSAFGARRRPAYASVVWWRMHVTTSNSWRSAVIAKANAVGRNDRHVKRRRELCERLVVCFFVAAEVPLQLDVHAVSTEQTDEAIHQAADAGAVAIEQRSTRERDKAACGAVELIESQRTFAFRRTQLHAGDQPAEISIALLAFAKQR